MNHQHNSSEYPVASSLHETLSKHLGDGGRVVCVGSSGVGKSTWIRHMVSMFDAPVRVLCADPGRPLVGPPGSVVCLNEQLEIESMVGLATMDCARYRMPLCAAVMQLFRQCPRALPLILDAPGITRGGGAHELLTGLAHAVDATMILAFVSEKGDSSYIQDLILQGFNVLCCSPDAGARRLSDAQRQRARDEAWSAFLGDPRQRIVPISSIRWLGAPPKKEVPAAWLDRQVVLCDARGQSVAMGFVARAEGTHLQVLYQYLPHIQPDEVTAYDTICMRDVQWRGGYLNTVTKQPALKSIGSQVSQQTDVPDAPFALRQKPKIRIHLSSGPLIQGANIRTTFVGDLFEDPMVLLRLDHRQRCLSFDLGEVGKVPTRIIHQTSDVFLSHAHLDHLGDLSWMLRRLVGIVKPVRVFGPAQIIERMFHGVVAYTWDRIGDRGPRFDVYEWDGGPTFKRALVQAGVEHIQWLPDEPVVDNCMFKEPRLEVHATVLDHGGTPVLAYSVEESKVYAVRGNIIRERGWKAGHWLGRLKTLAATGELDELVEVEHLDGQTTTFEAGELIELLLIPRPGQKIVYATDFADTLENREAVIALARDAHILICEAGFVMDDADQATRTGHMTTHGCGEIAKAANVQVLVPFHHSVRYEEAPEQVYREVLSRFDRTYVPLPILEVLESQGR